MCLLFSALSLYDECAQRKESCCRLSCKLMHLLYLIAPTNHSRHRQKRGSSGSQHPPPCLTCTVLLVELNFLCNCSETRPGFFCSSLFTCVANLDHGISFHQNRPGKETSRLTFKVHFTLAKNPNSGMWNRLCIISLNTVFTRGAVTAAFFSPCSQFFK